MLCDPFRRDEFEQLPSLLRAAPRQLPGAMCWRDREDGGFRCLFLRPHVCALPSLAGEDRQLSLLPSFSARYGTLEITRSRSTFAVSNADPDFFVYFPGIAFAYKLMNANTLLHPSTY